MTSRWPYRLARWGLAGVFLFAGAMKLGRLGRFAQTISEFGLVFDGLVMPAAVLLVALEIAAGLALLVDLRGGLELATALVAAYVGVLAYGIWLGLEIECDCFGFAAEEAAGASLTAALYRDLALLAVCGLLYASRYAASRRPRRLLEWRRDPTRDRPGDTLNEVEEEHDSARRAVRPGGAADAAGRLRDQQV